MKANHILFSTLAVTLISAYTMSPSEFLKKDFKGRIPASAEEKQEDVVQMAEHLEEILSPDGPYHWDLPPERLKVGDPDYEFFVCRTSLLYGMIMKIHSLLQKYSWPIPEAVAVSDALKTLNDINTRRGDRTEEEMLKIRIAFDRILSVLKKV